MPSGVSVAELGLKKIRDGKAADPSGLAPFYIRRSEAEINLEKKSFALGG
jgi:hypothetical protein